MRSADLYVVETAEDAFIGTIELVPGAVTVHSGFVGRPPVIPGPEVESITLADEHPLVTPA